MSFIWSSTLSLIRHRHPFDTTLTLSCLSKTPGIKIWHPLFLPVVFTCRNPTRNKPPAFFPAEIPTFPPPRHTRPSFYRPGILIHMNICGKRLGDKGIEILAPAIPAIRSVDLRRNNIGDRGVHAIVAAWKNACLIQLETLSLAGNRVGDSGANALSSMLEDGGDAKGSSPGKTKGFLRWLSLAGNPRVSAEARERLLQEAANKRNGSSNVPWVVVA